MPRVYPSDAVIERNILGAALIDLQVANTVLTELKADDFYADNLKNQKIFQAMYTLNDKGESIDVATVYNQLTIQKDAEIVGGYEYLNELLDSVVSLVNVEFYIKQLTDITLLRNFLKTLDKIQGDYQSKELKNINEFVGDAERQITEITSKRRVADFVSSVKAEEYGSKIVQTHGSEETISGLATGFSSLDAVLNGLGKGELIILAARPAVGKSAFALNIAFNASKNKRVPVAIFSLEMNAEMIFRRLFSMNSNIEYEKIQKGFLTQRERASIQETASDISKTDLYVDDSSGVSIDEIALKCRKLKESKGNLGLVVVDYIGLIDDEKNIYKDNEQAKIAFFSRRLKRLAGELECPVLCLAQLNRNTEQRESKMPQLSDLRSSGAIEQDADKVMFMYRPNYYQDQGISIGKKKKGEEAQQQTEQKPQTTTDIVKIIVAKNRNGRIGNVDLAFHKNFGRFNTIDKTQQARIDNAQNEAYSDIDD
ncbi:MAG: replicative DNA helicase [Bacilli bacterium]|nr:replicative DNA helicase [Bacilli bacterium]